MNAAAQAMTPATIVSQMYPRAEPASSPKSSIHAAPTAPPAVTMGLRIGSGSR